jgi:hypothetical protein
MPEAQQFSCSARTELDGIIYFPRMLDKIRLMEAGKLHPDLHQNLGRGMDLWLCQFLGVDYEELKLKVLSGASDDEALAWAREHGVSRPGYELAWFSAYMKTRGFRDDLSDRCATISPTNNRDPPLSEHGSEGGGIGLDGEEYTDTLARIARVSME